MTGALARVTEYDYGMSRTVFITDTSDANYLVHQSAFEPDGEAHEIADRIYTGIQDGNPGSPLMVQREGTKVWTVAHFNPARIVGVFVTED